MKKQNLLLALLLTSALSASAQPTPWFQIGNEWTYDMYLGWNPLYGLHRLVIIDDVMLGDNKLWTRFRRYHPDGGNNLFYYARQEGEKIYSCNGGLNAGTCIYDFAMQPGDTLFLHFSWRYYTVEDTASVFMAGRMRRTQTIRFSDPMYQGPLLLVEGIGPVGNPQEPGNPGFCSFFFLDHSFCHAPVDGMSAFFRCFADANGVYAPFAGCLVSSGEAESPDAIRVWPNPAHERLFVQGAFRTVELFDTHGRLVTTETTIPDGQTEIQIGHLPSGVYWLRCQTRGGELAVRKVVVAR